MPDALAISLIVVPRNPLCEKSCLDTEMIWARRSEATILTPRALEGLGLGGFDKFNRLFIVAGLRIAVVNGALLLGGFLNQISRTTLRA